MVPNRDHASDKEATRVLVAAIEDFIFRIMPDPFKYLQREPSEPATLDISRIESAFSKVRQNGSFTPFESDEVKLAADLFLEALPGSKALDMEYFDLRSGIMDFEASKIARVITLFRENKLLTADEIRSAVCKRLPCLVMSGDENMLYSASHTLRFFVTYGILSNEYAESFVSDVVLPALPEFVKNGWTDCIDGATRSFNLPRTEVRSVLIAELPSFVARIMLSDNAIETAQQVIAAIKFLELKFDAVENSYLLQSVIKAGAWLAANEEQGVEVASELFSACEITKEYSMRVTAALKAEGVFNTNEMIKTLLSAGVYP